MIRQIQELLVVHLRQYEHRSRVYKLRVTESMASTISTTSINLTGASAEACSLSWWWIVKWNLLPRWQIVKIRPQELLPIPIPATKGSKSRQLSTRRTSMIKQSSTKRSRHKERNNIKKKKPKRYRINQRSWRNRKDSPEKWYRRMLTSIIGFIKQARRRRKRRNPQSRQGSWRKSKKISRNSLNEIIES